MTTYKLNISRKCAQDHIDGSPRYEHFAQVSLAYITEKQAIARSSTFKEKFPSPEYQLRLTKWQEFGEDVAF